MKKLVVIATGNAGKVREFAKAFENSDPNLEFKTQKEVGFSIDVEENGSTFQENARIKALAVAEFLKAKQIQATVIADDSGLEVKALGGAPGIHSARFAGEHGNSRANNEKLLRELAGASDRSARFVCHLCIVHANGKIDDVEGECPGKIIEEFRGEEGFGYDPLFVANGKTQTFAEMSLEEKQALSHRGHAIEILKSRKILSEQSFLEVR